MVELHPLAGRLVVTTNFDEILIVCTKSGEMVGPSRCHAGSRIPIQLNSELFSGSFLEPS